MNRIRCSCGKIGSNDCLFKGCKNCCVSKYCEKHNVIENNQKPNESSCFICEQQNIHNLKLLNEELKFCEQCYKSNKKIFDNIIQEQIFISCPMFVVANIKKCTCDNICSERCCLKSCKHCCTALGCSWHKPNNVDNLNNKCTLCVKEKESNELNNYLNQRTNEIIYYCNECYIKHDDLLNNILLNNIEIEQYNKLIIKPTFQLETFINYKLEKEKQKELELLKIQEKKNKEEQRKKEYEEMEQFLDSYIGKIITKDILDNEIKKHKYYDSDCIDIRIRELNYQCPKCNKVVSMEETYFCEECDDLFCDAECIHYYDDDDTKHCNDCYIKPYKEFYDKYKDTILTAETIKLEDDMIDLSEFEELGYKLTYICPICEEIKNFNPEIIRDCDKCKNYVCHDCSIMKQSCGYHNCRRCANGYCYNAETKCFCSDCGPEYFVSDSEADSDSDFEESDDESIKNAMKKRSNSICEQSTDENTQCNICLTNKKNYACIPCGHLCMCGDCANQIDDKCPICKNKFTIVMKIFQ